MSNGLPDIKASITFVDAGATVTLDKVASATKKTGDAAKSAGEAAAKASTGVGVFGSSVGLAGQAIGRLNPALGQTVSVAGQALGSIQALSTMGLGPVGIALGVVSGLVTAGTALWTAHTAQLERTRQALDEVTTASARYREGQRQARLEEQSAAESAASRATGPTGYEIGAAENAAADEARRVATLRRIALLSEGAGLGDPNQARRGGGGSDRAKLAKEAAADAAESARSYGEALAQIQRETEAEQTALAQKGIDERAEASQRAVDQAIDDEERRVMGVRRAIDRETQAREKAAAVAAAIASAMDAAGQAVADIAEAAGASEEERAMAVAAATLSISIVKGALEVAEAAGSFASLNIPQGIAHSVAAAAYAVSAVKAAAELGGGGGGGSGAAPAASSPGGGPSAPTAGDSERGGNVYHITVGGRDGVFIADRDELYRTVSDGVRAADTRRGR